MLTPAEWGAQQAAMAQPWSDKKWREVCAILKLDVKPAPKSRSKRS